MARNIQAQKTTKDTIKDRANIAKHAPSLRKLFPNFDKLPAKKRDRAAVLKNLQGFFPDDPSYTDKAIKEKILGLATKDYETVTKDDLGRPQLVGKVKKKNPAGFKYGGKVKGCRGRKANYKA